MENKAWLVHGNWTGSGKHHVNTPKKVYNVKSLAQAKAKVISLAKARGQKTYDYETPSGRWVKRPVNERPIIKRRPTARRNVFGGFRL